MKGGSQREDVGPKSQTRLLMRKKWRNISSDVSSDRTQERPSTLKYWAWRFRWTFAIHFAITSVGKAGIPNLLWVCWGEIASVSWQNTDCDWFSPQQEREASGTNGDWRIWVYKSRGEVTSILLKQPRSLQSSNNNNWVLAISLKKTVTWTEVLLWWIPFSLGGLVGEFGYFCSSWTVTGVFCPLSQCSNWLKCCCQCSSCCWLNGNLYWAHKSTRDKVKQSPLRQNRGLIKSIKEVERKKTLLDHEPHFLWTMFNRKT